MSEQQLCEAEQPEGARHHQMQDPMSRAGSTDGQLLSAGQLAVPASAAQLEELDHAAVPLQLPLGGAMGEAMQGAAAAMLGHGPGLEGYDRKRPTICYDYCKNQCTRGAACKFSHDLGTIIAVNSQEKGLCFDFLKGLCTRGLLCRFSHDLRNLQCTTPSAKKRFAPICYDFVKNQCTRGEECKYSHDYSSILYGPRAPGKDPYVICVDYTRGKCARGASCRYSHVDPRMLSGSSLAAPPAAGVHPALLAAGLGAAAAAAAVAQTNTALAGAVPGAMQGALAGLNAATLSAPSRQPSDLQAQAALLLSGLGGGGLLGAAGLPPGTPVAGGGIPAAWNSLPAMQQGGAAAGLQQSPEGLAALLDQLQRTALTDSLAQLSPTAGDAVSLSAINALMAGGGLSPTYASGLAAAAAGAESLAAVAELQRSATLAASLLQTPAPGLLGMLGGEGGHQQAAQQQAAATAAAQQQQQMFGSGQQGAEVAAAAALLQTRLSDSSQLTTMGSGSAPVSAAPTPTAASAVPTIFSQQSEQRAPSPSEQHASEAPGGPLAPPPPVALPPKASSQPLMPVYHPLLQHKGSAGNLRGADILVDARSSGSPTIGASWGGAGALQQHPLAQPPPAVGLVTQQLKQQQQAAAMAAAAAGLPPPPPPVQIGRPRSALEQHHQQQVGTPSEMAGSYDQMAGFDQLIWGQRSIWGQRQ